MLKDTFRTFDDIAEYNNYKVLEAFGECGIAARHMSGSTGYGYSDEGRDKLGELFARTMATESALVSPLIASGTHAITTALFGVLRPGDVVLSLTGKPYDTLRGVVYKSGGGSLPDFGIQFNDIPILDGGKLDVQSALELIKKDKRIKVVYFQRSRGYEWRASIIVSEINNALREIREEFPNIISMVDNCYGEFVEKEEPCADVLIGSLIKNPGAGIAPTGGYIAGKEELIERISERLTCPGIGREIGSYQSGYIQFYQGLFFAPGVVRNALCGAALTAAVFESLGCDVSPGSHDFRTDITQAIKLCSAERMLELTRAVQQSSPIDSMATPYPWDMPGYQSQVVMAAGTFVQGGSIELSADGPMKDPFIVFMQGGLMLEQVKVALLEYLDKALRK